MAETCLIDANRYYIHKEKRIVYYATACVKKKSANPTDAIELLSFAYFKVKMFVYLGVIPIQYFYF